MKLSDMMKRLPIWYAASVEPKGASWRLRGPAGRGKSSLFETLPAVLEKAFGDGKYAIVVVNGACLTLTTATGYLWPVDGVDADGQPVKYSMFTRPDWWCQTIGSEGAHGLPLEAFTGGVIVIDEDDKMNLDEKKIVGEAALSKYFGTHKLPDGWVVWFSGNRKVDRSGSTKDFDHLINRVNEISVDDDLQSTLDWMTANGCLPETILFAEENPQLVFMPPPDIQGAWMTPRSLVAQDGYLRAMMEVMGLDEIPTDALTIEEVAGGVGAGPAAQYFATIRLGQELPKYEEILKHGSTLPIPVKPDVKRLAAYKYASKVTYDDCSKVLNYITRFPVEFGIMFVRMAVQRNPRIVMEPNFAAWCGQHAQLLSILESFKPKSNS